MDSTDEGKCTPSTSDESFCPPSPPYEFSDKYVGPSTGISASSSNQQRSSNPSNPQRWKHSKENRIYGCPRVQLPRYMDAVKNKTSNCMRIKVYYNGQVNGSPKLVVLHNFNKCTLKKVLAACDEAVKQKGGYSTILYSITGERIQNVGDLKRDGEYVTAHNNDKSFKWMFYGCARPIIVYHSQRSKNIYSLEKNNEKSAYGVQSNENFYHLPYHNIYR